MEINIFCITLSLVMAVLLVGIGVQIGRGDKSEPCGDSDTDIHISDRDRSGGSDNRYSAQEMIFVLDNVKRLTHGEERKIMDSIIKLVEGSKNNEVD